MTLKLKLLFFSLSLVKAFAQLELPQPAYFDIQIDRFEQIEADPEVFDLSSIKVRKVNSTQLCRRVENPSTNRK